MSKPTINQYVALNMIGTFPLARGYEGAMPRAAFELLVIAAESFIMIKGVNKDHIERNTLMIMFNELCGVTSLKGRVKENLFFERVMRAMNVSLNASVSPTVKIDASGGQRTRIYTPGSSVLKPFSLSSASPRSEATAGS
jgi:hypothetical protein